MRRFSILLLPTLLAVLAGCGSSSSSSSSSSSAPASSAPASTSGPSSGPTFAVAMKNLAFIPSALHAKVGQTIVWTNDDAPPHNVTYVSGPRFASSPSVMNTGATFKLKLTRAGTIHYFCTIHPFMKGTIVVSP